MIDSFLNFLQYEKRYSPHTVLSYRNDMNQFGTYLESTYEEEASRASYAMVRSWIVSLVEQGLDALTVNRKIASLRSFYKFLLRQEVISKNPMAKIKILKTKKKLPQFVKEPDMSAVLEKGAFEDNHEGWRDKLVLELLYGTGIRLSELIHLKENQVNLHERTIRVIGKRNKERVIPFSKSLVGVIQGYLKVRNREIDQNDSGFLIVTERGKKCYPMMIHRTVSRYLGEQATVEKKSPHVLRHTFATHLLNKGAEINAVKDLLGHSSLAATQVYTHNSMEKLKKAYDQAHPKA